MTAWNFTREIDKGLDILLKLQKRPSRKKDLLEKDKIVYLQISLFKIPYVPRRRRKFLSLCHSLYGDDPEICLFVPNKKTNVEYKKTTEEYIDFCVDHYTELLEKHKVKGIKTVMPVKQLKCEYGGYELRRKLVQRFDIFLCKNSLLYNPRFLTGLGKIFSLANKEPFGVSFPKEGTEYDPQFNKNIQRALFASSFFIQPYSDNYSVPIGRMSNTKIELEENLKTVLDQLFNGNMIPGGFKNVRALYIWPSQSKTIPLYVSAELPKDLKRPRVKPRKKSLKSVEGELSTQPGKIVTVTPRGNVFVTGVGGDPQKPQLHIDSEDDSFDERSDDGEDGEAKLELRKKSTSKSAKEEETDSEDDEEIEKREQKLLTVKRKAEADEEDSRRKKKPRTSEEGLEANVDIKEKKKGKKTFRNLQNGEVNSESKRLFKTGKGRKKSSGKIKEKVVNLKRNIKRGKTRNIAD